MNAAPAPPRRTVVATTARFAPEPDVQFIGSCRRHSDGFHWTLTLVADGHRVTIDGGPNQKLEGVVRALVTQSKLVRDVMAAAEATTKENAA